MDAEKFVKKLKDIPSKERVDFLRKQGLPKDFIEEYLHSYFFKKKNLDSHFSNDPIRDLIDNYDGASVKIGMITFDAKPKENLNYFYFAHFEVDWLVINKNLKTIEVIEYGSDKHVLGKCAQNSSKFLEAVVEAARFMEKCAYDDDLYNNNMLKCEVAEACAEIAGSKRGYQDFYKILIGCD